MSIMNVVGERGINEIVHFTSNHGLVGTLEVGAVLSRRQLPEVDHLAYIAAPTSAQRQEAMSCFDKAEDWLDFINLSLSEINQHYFNFAANKWHTQGDRWWTILSFRPEILTHAGVFFTTTNNIYEHVIRGQGQSGLEALFTEPIKRKGSWYARRNGRTDNLATCQQAEVLYPQSLAMDHLQRIYVATEEQHDLVSGWLRYYRLNSVSVTIQPEKFNGVPN
ncbi:DarT ssDNA thymidine ADP-ribosyltransferase family protein [Massilia sp. NR 4-1]|uniref:DarT ssDNA thymidine ADP-ribosyltransferase family protein n=1 Tax=Massilia sp. NR 4-1 TaxID=1678028 RepID=UPI0009E3D88F|nr:DarT ssDNA thymidine ADP-ribosyltransferase family protein [Massilia sp. NR 4-1]